MTMMVVIDAFWTNYMAKIDKTALEAPFSYLYESYHLVFRVTVSPFLVQVLIKICSKSSKEIYTLLICYEHLNVSIIYVENSVFFKHKKVTFNFKTHIKTLNSYF